MDGTFWEIFTLLTGAVYIVLEILQNKWMWAVGFLTAVAAMAVFWSEGLYASFSLNCYYFAISAYGLWQWMKDERRLKASVAAESAVNDSATGPGGASSVHLTRLTPAVAVVSALLFAGGTAGFYFLAQMLGDSQPLMDVTVTVLSAIATWWLAKSYREQWLLWIVADAATFALCVRQGLPWMSVLYGLYCASAVYGYIRWRRKGEYVTI